MNTTRYSTGVAVCRRALYLTTTLLSFVGATLPAHAQAQQAVPADQKKSAPADEKSKTQSLEEVVVTGTLIRGIAPAGSNLISTTREDINSSGATDANQLLNQLPQSAGFMSIPQPGAGVITGVGRVPLNQPNLRNLPGGATGNPVTLVMIDGHRIVPSGIEQSLVDVGIVPTGVLERVETILDGAGAIYGTDAVGGVINYITRKPFDQTKAAVQYGFADNYHAIDADVTSGTIWDGGGIDFTYSYASNTNLLNKNRDYAIARNYLLPGAPFTGTACEDHSTVAIPPPPAPASQTFSAPALTPGTINCPSNAFTSFVAAQDRHAGFLVFSQDLSDTVKLATTALYSYRKTDQSFAPPNATVTIRQGINPYFQLMPGVPAGSQATQSVAFSYGPVVGTDFNHYVTTTDLWQVTPTVSIDVGSWQIRTLFGYGKSTVTFESPLLDTTAQGVAIGAAGSPLLSASAAINPYNIAGSANLALVKSLFYTTHSHGTHTLTQARVVADGPLFALPGGDLKAAFGVEWSKTDFERVSTSTITRLLNPAINASVNPKSVFAEFNVPIVGESNKLAGIQALDLSLSGRYDDYEQYGTTVNPKVSITYRPLDWLTLRVNGGKSFRAPTVVDKVGSQVGTLTCLGNITVAGCVANVFTALPPGVPLPAGTQIALTLSGARPDLRPETSKNWSAGFDLRPIENLIISPTFFHIDYTDLISIPNVGITLTPSFQGAPQLFTFNPTAAQVDAFATRALNGAQVVSAARASGNILYLFDGRTTNLGKNSVSGLDLNISYRIPTSFGSIDTSINGTKRIKGESQFFPGGAVVDDLALDTSLLRLSAQVAATIGDFRAQATLLHRGGFDVTPSATRLASQTEISSFTLLNLSFNYNINGDTPMLQDLALTLTINNVLDKDPPIALTTTGGSALGAGQTIGRFVQFGVNKEF